MILDGKMVRDKLLDKYKEEILKNNLKLTLAIIYVGDNKASKVYINNKIKYSQYVGINTRLYTFDENAKEQDIIECINILNNDDSITGIILQSPVPKQINFDKCAKLISPSKDIDGFTLENQYALVHNLDGLRPCTAKGIMKLLDYYDIDVTGKNVCIIGRGNLVGKPVMFEMLNHDATVSICHSKTDDIKKHTKDADIIVLGVGKPNILTYDMIKDGATVIDAGISVVDGHSIGDADFDGIKDKCKFITPTPGGVGPMTVAMIIDNVIKAGGIK